MPEFWQGRLELAEGMSMSQAMRPLNGRVLLKRPPISEKIGSIIIPERARMVPQEGTVVAISQGAPCLHCGYAQQSAVQVGEQVLHGRFARMGLPAEYGNDLYLIWTRDIMAVLEP